MNEIEVKAASLPLDDLRKELALTMEVRDTLDANALVQGTYRAYYDMRDDCTLQIYTYLQELMKRHEGGGSK